jgi:hypothetical protein
VAYIVTSCKSRVIGLGVLKSISGRGSVRVIEDILLSERGGGGGSRENSRVSCRKRSERKQGREMAYKKVQVLTKILRNRAF